MEKKINFFFYSIVGKIVKTEGGNFAAERLFLGDKVNIGVWVNAQGVGDLIGRTGEWLHSTGVVKWRMKTGMTSVINASKPERGAAVLSSFIPKFFFPPMEAIRAKKKGIVLA